MESPLALDELLAPDSGKKAGCPLIKHLPPHSQLLEYAPSTCLATMRMFSASIVVIRTSALEQHLTCGCLHILIDYIIYIYTYA